MAWYTTARARPATLGPGSARREDPAPCRSAARTSTVWNC